MPEATRKVRPLREDDQSATSATPPRLPLVLAILVIGALVGWGFAAVGDTSSTTLEAGDAADEAADASPVELAEPDPVTEGAVDWVKATDVPPIPDGYDYAGATKPVEFDGSLYMIVRFANLDTRAIRNELWSSDDGVSWDGEQLQFDDPVAIIGLVAARNNLVISGSAENLFAMWTSVPDRTIDGSSWNRVDLNVPDGIDISYHATVVNDAGEVVTTIIANSNIWREAIAPFVPEGIDPQDPRVTLSLADLYLPDGGTSIALFAERPEVVTTDDSVWVRLVTIDGEEIMKAYDLPLGVYPVEANPDLRFVRVALSWFSRDGVTFLPVVGTGAVPDGYFLPEPWGDGFIAASYAMEGTFEVSEDIRLWETNSGRAWQPIALRPPSQCTEFFTASSGDRILLTSDSGIHCLGTVDGEWEILEDTVISSYVVGGPGGFIGYPDGFNYDTALFSPDGETWTSLKVPAAEPYPTLVSLQDRLFMLSVNPATPGRPKRIDLWLADIP